MTWLPNFSFTNKTNEILQNATMVNETGGRVQPLDFSFTIGTILAINSIACPFTVLLNVLVIMAVKKRPGLQNNTNILLSCLAVTDLLTGLLAQPSFLIWKTFYVLKNARDITAVDVVKEIHNSFLRVLTISSSLHLILLTCERLITIKCTNHYSYIVRKRNFKVLVLAIWSFSFMAGALRYVKKAILKDIMKLLHFFTMYFSVIFIVIAYIILYRETLRHRKRIIKQQLPQAEIERFVKENKALKTTVLVVGTIILCFLPMSIYQLFTTVFRKRNQVPLFSSDKQMEILVIVVRTLSMLNFCKSADLLYAPERNEKVCI